MVEEVQIEDKIKKWAKEVLKLKDDEIGELVKFVRSNWNLAQKMAKKNYSELDLSKEYRNLIEKGIYETNYLYDVHKGKGYVYESFCTDIAKTKIGNKEFVLYACGRKSREASERGRESGWYEINLCARGKSILTLKSFE